MQEVFKSPKIYSGNVYSETNISGILSLVLDI